MLIGIRSSTPLQEKLVSCHSRTRLDTTTHDPCSADEPCIRNHVQAQARRKNSDFRKKKKRKKTEWELEYDWSTYIDPLATQIATATNASGVNLTQHIYYKKNVPNRMKQVYIPPHPPHSIKTVTIIQVSKFSCRILSSRRHLFIQRSPQPVNQEKVLAN